MKEHAEFAQQPEGLQQVIDNLNLIAELRMGDDSTVMFMPEVTELDGAAQLASQQFGDRLQIKLTQKVNGRQNAELDTVYILHDGSATQDPDTPMTLSIPVRAQPLPDSTPAYALLEDTEGKRRLHELGSEPLPDNVRMYRLAAPPTTSSELRWYDVVVDDDGWVEAKPHEGTDPLSSEEIEQLADFTAEAYEQLQQAERAVS